MNPAVETVIKSASQVDMHACNPVLKPRVESPVVGGEPVVESAGQVVVQSTNDSVVNLVETLVELPSPAGTHLGDWPGITVPSQPPISSSSNATNDIQLSGELTPHKIKKGVPVWFKRMVSPAFEANVFWPSPPKTKCKHNVSAQIEKELFPACASTAKWRELHRQRKEKQSKKQKQQPSKQMDALQSTSSAHTLEALKMNQACDKQASAMKKKGTYSICVSCIGCVFTLNSL